MPEGPPATADAIAGAALTRTGEPKAEKLEIFISYASEDKLIADALQKSLEEHLGDFANPWIDSQGLRAGFDISKSIKDQLDISDILIVVFTGQLKESHGFTGVEVGYFMGSRGPGNTNIERRIVSFHLHEPPAPTSGIEGLSYGITESLLKSEPAEYAKTLSDVNDDNPIVRFYEEELETGVDQFRQKAGLPPLKIDSATRLERVRKLLKATFEILKKRKEREIHPQRKIEIRVEQNLTHESSTLPNDAVITPVGAGVIDVFKLDDRKISWAAFLQQIGTTAPKYAPVWKDAIEAVIISSMGAPNIDNSQIIPSYTGHDLYRIILTQSTKYYNDVWEFHLYFVETLPSRDFGNDFSTKVAKALGLCCRFRFMFLEKESEFSSFGIRTRKTEEIKDHARKLVKELNLIYRDSIKANLDDPLTWAGLIDPRTIEEMNILYSPIEQNIRDRATDVLSALPETLHEKKMALADAVVELEDRFSEGNAMLIDILCTKLSKTENYPKLSKTAHEQPEPPKTDNQAGLRGNESEPPNSSEEGTKSGGD